MNIKDYEYIVEIEAQGSISKAADRLSITPGALSKYLNRIEKELSIQLFKRIGNQFVPTKAGLRYVELGRVIMNVDEQLKRDIAGMIECGDAALHLGVPRGMNSFIMERLLPGFYEQFESEQVVIERGGSKALISMVEDGKLDVCIAYASDRKPNLIYQKLAHVEPVLAVPAGSLLLTETKKKTASGYPILDNDSWFNEAFISITTSTYSGRIVEEMFSKYGKRPPVKLYVGDTETALSAVENNLGNTIVLALPQTDRMVRFLALPYMIDHGVDVYAVTRRNGYHSESMEALIKIAQKYYSCI
ncbi:LysR family transcriptional regulator [Oribacterium sp. KHPX15]|uniref:LysR family transcriptional regulator n=1 Tax=Oribacterium sp. KHPX15 TaxID=1855342 RepID=UPI0015872500|nr:LysR family transcriptional regulator [Oribacterium sp. KHPX15]